MTTTFFRESSSQGSNLSLFGDDLDCLIKYILNQTKTLPTIQQIKIKIKSNHDASKHMLGYLGRHAYVDDCPWRKSGTFLGAE